MASPVNPGHLLFAWLSSNWPHSHSSSSGGAPTHVLHGLACSPCCLGGCVLFIFLVIACSFSCAIWLLHRSSQTASRMLSSRARQKRWARFWAVVMLVLKSRLHTWVRLWGEIPRYRSATLHCCSAFSAAVCAVFRASHGARSTAPEMFCSDAQTARSLGTDILGAALVNGC